MAVIIWVTGPQASGKTTIARQLTDRLREYYQVGWVDDDEMRQMGSDKIVAHLRRHPTMQETALVNSLRYLRAAHLDVVVLSSINKPAKRAVDQFTFIIELTCPKKIREKRKKTNPFAFSVTPKPAKAHIHVPTDSQSVEEILDGLFPMVLDRVRKNMIQMVETLGKGTIQW